MNDNTQLLHTLEIATTHIAAALTRCSRDLRYVWANQPYADWIQRPLSEIVDRPIAEVLGKDALEALLPHFNRVLTGEAVRYEQETKFRGIGQRWISAAYTPTLDAGGAVDGWVAVVVDITERKQAERALRESEERFRMAAQAGKMYAYDWDVATDVITRSGDFSEVLGLNGEASLTREQLLARLHPDDRASFIASVTERSPESPDVQISYRTLCPDGSIVWLEKTAHAVFGADGKMVRMIGMVANITQRKRAEDTIRESEMRYSRIVRTTNEGVWLLDSSLCTSFVNQQLAEMLKYEPEEMVGRSVFDFYFPEDVEQKRQVLDRRRQGLRERIEERLRRKDGSELWVEIAGTPLFRDDGEFDGAFAMVSDITERKRAERAIRESEQRFRLVADTAPVMIWMSGLDKRPTYFNQLWLEFTGLTETDLLNRLAGIVHPEDYQDGLGTYCRAFDQRQPFRKECRLRRHDGQYRWMLDIGVPRFHHDGSFAGYIGSCMDITEQKLAQEALSSISRRLIEAHEHERTRIARELHDDISQRLVLVAMDLDRQRRHLNPPRKELRSVLGEATKQISELVSDVHMMSHRLHCSKLDTLGLAAAAAGFCRELSERQQVAIDFHSDGIPQKLPDAIALSMFRVLQEALQNAAKHSGAKHFSVSLVGGAHQIALAVCDEGRGFNPQEALRGRGLGLTSMKERLKLVGGELLIDAGPQGGTTIRASVPFDHQVKSASAGI